MPEETVSADPREALKAILAKLLECAPTAEQEWPELVERARAALERKPEENYGNVAELRKTLEDAHHLIEAFLATVGDRAMKHEFLEMRYRIQDALAAPPRNCDKYSLDDIKEMDRDFRAFCHKFPGHCTGCPIKPMDNLCCHSAWLLMPAEGGAS